MADILVRMFATCGGDIGVARRSCPYGHGGKNEVTWSVVKARYGELGQEVLAFIVPDAEEMSALDAVTCMWPW